MRIILFGASGLLGTAVHRAAVTHGHTVTVMARSPLPGQVAFDAASPRAAEALTRQLLDDWPDAIINCAAVSSAAACDLDPRGSSEVNCTLPATLARLAHHLGCRFMHISTDMVFDGDEAPYRSTSTPCPRGLYGQQKLLAERSVLQAAADVAVVLRLPLLTGTSLGGRRSLHEVLFTQWADGRATPLFEDEFRTPASAENCADLVVELLDRRELTGLFHWSGSERLSRAEMGRRLLARFNLPGRLIHTCLRADVPGCANRPHDLSLDPAPLVSKVRSVPESFSEQLARLGVPLPFRPWYQGLKD